LIDVPRAQGHNHQQHEGQKEARPPVAPWARNQWLIQHLGNVAGGSFAAGSPETGQQLLGVQSQELRIVADESPGIHVARQHIEALFLQCFEENAPNAGGLLCLLQRKPLLLTGFAQTAADFAHRMLLSFLLSVPEATIHMKPRHVKGVCRWDEERRLACSARREGMGLAPGT